MDQLIAAVQALTMMPGTSQGAVVQTMTQVTPTPAATPPAPTQPVAPIAPVYQPPVQQPLQPIQAPAAPTYQMSMQQPISQPVAPTVAAPTATPTYTLDQISQAAAIFAGQSQQTREAALALLARFGVGQITALPPEQYDSFVMGLRQLGAVI